jgi:DNA-binding GntR family transcriptional regulator
MEIETLSVTNSIVEYLRAKIILGELPGGQRLNENQLAPKLGISRPPMREAFRILEHEHVIVSIPRKGAYIKELSINDCQEVYQMREMLECYAVDLLKFKNILSLPEVSSSLASASGLSIPPDDDQEQRLKYLKIFADFHIKLVEAAGNNRLDYFYKSIQSTLYRYQFLYLSLPGAGPHSMEEHQRILDLITAGAYDEAKKYIKTHMDRMYELLVAKMKGDKIKG